LIENPKAKDMSFELTRVEAPTMREALQKIRAALGSDAIIVSTRTYKHGGLLGVGAQEVVEVYAADTRSRIENIKREKSSRARWGEVPEAAASEVSATVESKDLPRGTARVASPTVPAALEHIRREIQEVLSRPGEECRYNHPFLRECYETLIARDLDVRVAEYVVEEVARLKVPSGYPDPARVRSCLRAQLSRLFVAGAAVDEKTKPRIVVLVGPTGVGKTTTIAKLAARAKINDRRMVGLITLDTFRIAAVDQLEKYAQIIGLPLYVATTPAEFETAVDDLRSRKTDVIFVDSAGRSHRDELKMTELRKFLAAAPGAETHLVLSTTTHGKTMLNVANRFERVGFDHVVLTKVDETISFGSLAGALVTMGRPVSFITDGQNVPDDIVACDPERLADLVLKTNAL
jgi:flagellar biosynthesis protein FlhF